MTGPKVVFLSDYVIGLRAQLAAKLTRPARLVDLPSGSAPAALAAELADAEVVVTTAWDGSLPRAPRLRLLQVAGAGTERIIPAAVPPGATVCNAFGHEEAIAEYSLIAMLVWCHRFIATLQSFAAGSWHMGSHGAGPVHGELHGKTVGLVGLGRIGRAVARRAAAFDTRVLAANRTVPPQAPPGVEAVLPLRELDRLLPDCDFVVVTTALTPETAGLIDARRLALMKPGAVIINVGRGPVIVEAALYEALRDGRIGGAVIDVWYRYPPPGAPDQRPSFLPFHELPNILMTPHSSGWTQGMLDRRLAQMARNIDRVTSGAPFDNIVRAPA